MEEFFKYLGKKTGQTLRRGKWIYKSVLGSQEEAIDAEYFVGKEIAKTITGLYQIDTDEKVKALLETTGARLRDKVKNAYRKFSFNSIISDDVNAFALPGGFIYATSSILKLTNYKEDEIAFVLGHEMGHVVRWHIFNRTIANSSLNMLAMVSKPGGLVGSLAVRTINSLLQKGYSRDQEFEADSFGTILMYAAGYNPDAAIVLLEKLERCNTSGSTGFNYFSTHPVIKDRIKKINYIIENKLKY